MPVPSRYVLCEPWVIHQVGTMKFIGDYRSGTHHDPVTPNDRPPRFFESVRSAQGFIAQWRRGRIINLGDGELDCRAQLSRKTVEFEIIQLQLVRVP